jgi:hypothetical protein
LAVSGQVNESSNKGTLNFSGSFDTPLKDIFKGVYVQLSEQNTSTN